MPTQHTLDTQTIALDRIHPNPENPRHDLGDLTDLAADIAEHGIIQPVIVHAHPDTAGDFMLIAGHRRLAAAELAGLADAPAVVRDRPDQVTLLELMLSENLQRSGLDPIDEGLALAKIKASGRYKRIDDIARHVHRSKVWVTDRLALVAKLPEDIWPAIRSGAVTIGDAVAVASVKGIDDDERTRLLQLPAAQRGWEITSAKRRADTDARRARMEATWGELHNTLPPHDVGWDYARLGDGLWELNVPAPLHASCPGHWVTWNGVSEEPAVFCTRPELHDLSEYVTEPPADWPDDRRTAVAATVAAFGDWRALAAAGAEPVDGTWDADARLAHVGCPGNQVLTVPWGGLVVCAQPAVHDPGSADHIDAAQLAERAASAPPAPTPGGGHAPGPRPGPGPRRWEPSDRLIEELSRRLHTELDVLPEAVQQLITCVLLQEPSSDDMVDTLIASLEWPFWDGLRRPSMLDDRDRPIVPAWLWVLSAVTDTGEPLPTLDELSTRLDVLTRGEITEEESPHA